MTCIFERTYPRTIDELVARFSTPGMRGARVDAWLFDDQAARLAAQAALRAMGVEARLHSAYKPLLHFFLEDMGGRALTSAAIGYPCHSGCEHNRFLLETYPLAGLLPHVALTLFPSGKEDFFYDVALQFADGHRESHRVFAPNRVHEDYIGETTVSPTGWLMVNHVGRHESARLETTYETLFHDVISAIAAYDWGDREPYFEELNIAVSLPMVDHRLPYGEESISLSEALHEDIYFSLLEIFQKKSGRPVGDRGLRPGQIVPVVQCRDGSLSARVEVRSFDATDTFVEAQSLEGATRPLSAQQIQRELINIGGERFTATSYVGRDILATYVKGTDVPMMVSGGQHANETTGVVGALRAATRLIQRGGAHFSISPQDNPDGYELHQRLRASQPHHMHHAARYTALGDDLEYRSDEGFYERAIRKKAETRTNAVLHVNLHGYPAHEWTRPLSGYVPRTFAMWTLPKGHFLIMRHHAGWAERAEKIIMRVTRHLADIDELMAFNAAQLRLFELHAGAPGLRMINGIPCQISLDDRHATPMTLISEYPDETIYGEAFIRGHTAQMETVLAAYAALQDLI